MPKLIALVDSSRLCIDVINHDCTVLTLVDSEDSISCRMMAAQFSFIIYLMGDMAHCD